MPVHKASDAHTFSGQNVETDNDFRCTASGKGLVLSGGNKVLGFAGNPEGSVTAPAGSIGLDTDGDIWYKSSGSGNTGWILLVRTKVATKTWDPGSIADGETVTTTITIVGVGTTNTVLAALSTIGTNEVLISANVQSTDTVKIVIKNETGGVLDLGSGTLLVRAFF